MHSSQVNRLVWVMVGGLVALLCGSASDAHAAAQVAASMFGEASLLALGARALLIVIGAAIIIAIALDAIGSFQAGNISRGIIGSFGVMFSLVLLFVSIPAMADGPVAAAAVLR